MLIRPSTESDAAAIAAIYAHFVRTSTCSFEETPPDAAEIAARRAGVLEAGLPYLVAEQNDEIVGYAYASLYRPRTAYRFTVENSVYVAAGHHGAGIGLSLMEELLRLCEAGPWQQIIAVIGGADNTPSIRLHERLGFRHVGTLHHVGFKFDGWVDTVLMQRALDGQTVARAAGRHNVASLIGSLEDHR